MKLAPIILFAYNRPRHTEQTLVALSQNYLAEKSSLYVFCDGPKKGATKEDLLNIEKVSRVVRKKQWCNEVVIQEQEENLGLANSVIQGVTAIIEKHGRVIVLEDDIVTGNYFLKFMNEGLDLYENEEKVFGISGYSYPAQAKIESATYFLPISSSWSYATWASRWGKIQFDPATLLKEIKDKKLQQKMNFGNYPFYKILENQFTAKSDSWAICFYASMFLNKGYFLYPNKSLAHNIGFDASGTHCKEDDFFGNIHLHQEKVEVTPIEIALNDKFVNLVKNSFLLRSKTAKQNTNIKYKGGIIKKIKSKLKKGFM